MMTVMVVLRLHQVGSYGRSNRIRRRRGGWSRKCSDAEQNGNDETMSEFLHEVSLQDAPIFSVASAGECEMNDTVVQSCVAPIGRTIFRASEHFVGIHAPQSGLPNEARESLCSNVTPHTSARIHHNENARLDDGVDCRVGPGMVSKTHRLGR